jgi:DNA modification methylase
MFHKTEKRKKQQGARWPADAVQRFAVDKLIPYARNARTHSPAQIAQIAASIREWGFTVPVLIDEAGMIIAGHGRVLAAQQLGLDEVPVIVARGWTEAQKRAYVIADNKLTENGGWDEALLKVEFADLAAAGFDTLLMGFDEFEVARLTGSHAGLTDPDAAPELPANPKSRRGELWLLGRHRLLCGDATNADDVSAALGGVKPHLMVTDPPYGVNYNAAWREGADLNLGLGLGKKGSGRALGAVANDDRCDWREAWALFPGDVAYVWHASWHTSNVQTSLECSGFDIRYSIIWAKQLLVFGRGDYHWQHEPCWYAVRKHRQGHWNGARDQTTLWSIKNNNPLGGGREQKTGHSTQKPVECMRRPIENNSSPGQAVYDPFVGSGTTIIAAEMTARSCHAIEVNPAYVDVTIQRWQDFTGEKATREADGALFDDLTRTTHARATRTKTTSDTAQAVARQSRTPKAERRRDAAGAGAGRA